MIVPRSPGARVPPYVLVLEDVDAIANLLRDQLSAEGYRSFSLRSKSSAERFLKRVRPDLVIVDYGLLGGSGITAAQMAAKAGVPVIVMSGYLTARDEIEPLGFLYVQKPFRVTEMVDLVRRLLARDPPSERP
jgi:DNA-binding response OmpR family regulator